MGQQQDAEEFLNFLMDGLHQELQKYLGLQDAKQVQRAASYIGSTLCAPTSGSDGSMLPCCPLSPDMAMAASGRRGGGAGGA
eukprot:COSAG01_NODE_13840_length_1528_cov_0.977607_3_plen_81_part_01